MVAAGDVWEGHELLNEERGLLRHFLARQVGDTGALVWLHLREGARLDAGLFAEEIARLQRLSDEVPEVVPVLYGGVNGAVAWAASPVLGDAIPLIDATRGNDLGPADLEVLIDIGRCLVRAHELSFIHGALSPDRVSIGGDGRYAITHFGFARLFQLGPEDARQDTYGYAPPELFSGGQLGPRADVYGFGTIMYELLCKRALSPWTRPPSFPNGIHPMLQVMMQRALEENPNRRLPSIDKMLCVLTPFAREWEELGAPPAPPHADIFAQQSGARRKPHEAAPILVEDEANAFASGEAGEAGGRAGEFPTPRPSDVPDTVESVPPRDAADSVTDASSVATQGPSETPATLKSAIPPRAARDNVTHVPPVALRSPPAPELPDLEPMLPVPPVPSTPPRSPVLPVPPAPSTPPHSSRTPGRRSPPRWFGAVLALAFVLGSATAVLRRESPRHVVPRLGPVVQAAAGRATLPPSARPLDRRPEPLPGAATPPVAARPRTTRPAAPTRQTMKMPAQEPDLCDGLLPCQKVFY